MEALRAFTCLVTATLGDAHAKQLAQGQQAQAELSAEQALHALQKLAVQQHQQPRVYAAEDNAGVRAVVVGCDVFCSVLRLTSMLNALERVQVLSIVSACPRHP